MKHALRHIGIAVALVLVGSASIYNSMAEAAVQVNAVDAPAPARGALAVGAAQYAPPTDAIYVSPRGNNTNAGTLTAPLLTVAAGLAKAPPGGTVVLRAGVYHESVLAAQTVTVENYPGEAAWLDGSSVVKGWVKSGTTWVKTGWTKEFSSMMGGDAAFKARFVSSDYPMAADPDQVFLNGVQLAQVGSASKVKTGTFFVDDPGNRIVVGSDPTGKEVRASDLKQAITLSGDNSVLRGIGVRRYANGYEYGGAVQLRGVGAVVENVVVQDVATIGLAVRGANKTVNRVSVNRAGLLGIVGSLNDNSVVENSIASDNDTQGFKPEPTAGGMKFGASRTITIRNNEANRNGRGSGIWLDVSCYDVTLVANTASSNLKYGLEVELSSKGIIGNNTVANDKEAGLVLLDASDFQIFNNDIGGTNGQAIKMAQDERRQADGLSPEGMDPRSIGLVDPTVTWVTGNITVSNNVFGNQGSFSKGSYQLFGLDNRTHRAMDDWNVAVDGNLFNPKVDSNSPSMVAWGDGDNVGLRLYETPAVLAAAKNPAWANAQVARSERIEDMGPDKTTYATVARPLPEDVAAAIGQPAGTQQLGAMPVNPLPTNPPTAAFTSTSTGPSVAFDGSGSTDANGTVISYRWDFGDGTFGAGATPTHLYHDERAQTVTLTVTDNSGGTAAVSHVVTPGPPEPPEPPENIAPTAKFASVVTNESVAFDGSASADSDGTVTTYAWDFGDTSTDSTTGATPTHTYANPGDHTVTLTVTDDRGDASDTISHVVTTNEPGTNSAPSAAFDFVVTDQSVAFDAGGSADSDGTISTYAWDFGDGSSIDSTTGVEPTHVYSAAGSYPVTLTVTDNGTAATSVSRQVTVSVPTTPLLANDTFLRTVTGGWGSANVGGAWTLTGGNARFNISGGLGKMLLPAGLTLDADMTGVSSSATVVTASFSVNKLADGTYIAVVPRQVGTNFYYVRVRLSADGTVVMNLLLNNSTLIGSAYTVPGLKVVPGQLYTIKAEARGINNTTISGKIWKTVGGTEPAAWQRTGSNAFAALQAAGHVGLFGKLPSNPPAGIVPLTLSWASFKAEPD